jgi:hypothetical protein
MKPAAKLASGVACTGVATTGTKERSTGFGHIADASPAEAHLVRSQVPRPTLAPKIHARTRRVKRVSTVERDEKSTAD